MPPRIRTLNPATGRLEREFKPFSRSEVEAAIGRSHETFGKYRRTSLNERSRGLFELARVLDSRANELGRLITLEMGKPLEAAIGEIRKCAWNCRAFAENGPRFLTEERVDLKPGTGVVRFEPLGVILAIMPWNFPFWQVFRFAAPALMAGNTIVLKHASNVPQCALEIEKVVHEAGFPDHVFQTLLVGSEQVAPILSDARVAAVTITGSVAAGRSVAEAAGRSIKKIVLELGGSDPFIVMPSVDLDHVAQAAAQARVLNSGQSCVAAKRFIAVDPVSEAFELKFVAAMRSLKIGDPLREPQTQVGPLATEDLLEKLDAQVQRSVEMGAKLLLGGNRLEREGFYYAPTVLTNIPEGSPARIEEIFGPVASLFRARDARHAIEIANETEFGLGASVWTRDRAEQELFSRELQAGFVAINQKVASDPRLPFGGVKQSGYGRELGKFGIREFVNIKTVVLVHEPA